MSRENPDHHDAQLVLQVYDLRREAVMRESRNEMFAKFWPKSYDDFVAITKPDNPQNRAFRQVSGYWEMVYGMVKHGIVHPEYFMEANGEGLVLFSKIQPHLERFRKEMSPTAFQNAEWVATNTETGKRFAKMFQERFSKMADTAK